MWRNKGVLLINYFAIALAVLSSCQYALAYAPISKESIFADILLTDILSRMDKDLDQSNNYFDMDAGMPKSVDLVSRSSKNNAPDDFEYRSMFASGSSNPSIRDQEYLQHSSLWGHQYMSGGMGEVPNRFSTIVKTDASLPAYCNPPNPCPYGYENSQACIPDMDFENTAIYSREFQAAQECTCDNEHMFDCAGQDSSANTNEMTSTMEKFLMDQFQNENGIDSTNGVVKKFYGFANQKHGGFGNNPYLQGDRLPIAAKKGNHINF